MWRRPATVCITLALLQGCHRAAPPATAIPPAALWAERSDAELDQALTTARQRAQASGRRVLLEFVAPWCDDCREMTRIDALPPAAEVLAERYERVRVNVGAFDRHRDLLARYHIDRIAAYVVLDPATGARVAQTTLEPITGHQPMNPERWAVWLRNPR